MSKERIRPVEPHEVAGYLRKAEEFLAAARNSLEQERFNAAASASVHCAINAADAITGKVLGKRSGDPDHRAVERLLNRCGSAGSDAATMLTRLIPLKHKAEYDADMIPPARARDAVTRAERVLAASRSIVMPDP